MLNNFPYFVMWAVSIILGFLIVGTLGMYILHKFFQSHYCEFCKKELEAIEDRYTFKRLR